MFCAKTSMMEACIRFARINKSMKDLWFNDFFSAKTITIPMARYEPVIMISVGILRGCQRKRSPPDDGYRRDDKNANQPEKIQVNLQ
jgi:hypothetical protein